MFYLNNKLKLMFLSILLLVSQLNGLLIKFTEMQGPVEVNIEGCEKLFQNLSTHPLPDPSKTYVELNIIREEFDQIAGFLMHFNRINNDFMEGRIQGQEAKDRILHELEGFGSKIEIIKRIRASLNWYLLDSVLLSVDSAFLPVDSVSIPTQKMGISQAKKEELTPEQLRDAVFLKPTSDDKYLLEFGGQSFLITKEQVNLSSVLKQMFDLSEIQDSIYLVNINVRTMTLLLPFWNRAARIDKLSKDRDATIKMIKDEEEILSKEGKALSLQQLDSLIVAANFLDIAKLVNFFAQIISEKLLALEGLNLFREHPEKFLQGPECIFKFITGAVDGGLVNLIKRNMLQRQPLLNGFWEMHPEGRKIDPSIFLYKECFASYGIININLSDSLASKANKVFKFFSRSYGRHDDRVYKASDELYDYIILSDGNIATFSKNNGIQIWAEDLERSGNFICLINLGHSHEYVFNMNPLPNGGFVFSLGRQIVAFVPDLLKQTYVYKVIYDAGPNHFLIFEKIIVTDDCRIVVQACSELFVLVPNDNEEGYDCILIEERDAFRICCCAVMPDGKIIIGLSDLSIKVFTPNVDGRSYSSYSLYSHFYSVSKICTMPNGWFVSRSDDGQVKVWEPNRCGKFSSKDLKQRVARDEDIFTTTDFRIVIRDNSLFDRFHLLDSKLVSPLNLTLEQILFIKAYKDRCFDLSNPFFQRIKNSLNIKIQKELGIEDRKCCIQ